MYGLPKIDNPNVTPETVDQVEARTNFETMEMSLNAAQRSIVHTIIKSIQMSSSEVVGEFVGFFWMASWK